MITVNPIYIDYVLDPLVGGADNDEAMDKYGHYNSDDENDVKLLAKEVLLPRFLKQPTRLQTAIKNSLAYYLVYPKQNFEAIFNSMLTSIETPTNSRIFFQWIWEVFFDGESKDFIKEEIVVEDFDVNAPYYLLTNTDGYNTPLN